MLIVGLCVSLWANVLGESVELTPPDRQLGPFSQIEEEDEFTEVTKLIHVHVLGLNPVSDKYILIHRGAWYNLFFFFENLIS